MHKGLTHHGLSGSTSVVSCVCMTCGIPYMRRGNECTYSIDMETHTPRITGDYIAYAIQRGNLDMLKAYTHIDLISLKGYICDSCIDKMDLNWVTEES